MIGKKLDRIVFVENCYFRRHLPSVVPSNSAEICGFLPIETARPAADPLAISIAFRFLPQTILWIRKLSWDRPLAVSDF